MQDNSALRTAALRIAAAGIEAVNPQRLVTQQITADQARFQICEQEFLCEQLDRIIVIGAGKATLGMAAGLEAALAGTPFFSKLVGHIQIPEGQACPLNRLISRNVRPAGMNEPTPAAVQATRQALRLVQSGRPNDLVIVLLSGGASALFTLPPEDIGLETKVQLTRRLSLAGASIHQLNAVRSQISDVKGGKLIGHARCPVITLAISDVIGDSPGIIGSGPTVPPESDAANALAILDQFQLIDAPGFLTVVEYLRRKASTHSPPPTRPPFRSADRNQIIGSIHSAMRAASQKAAELGFDVQPGEIDLLQGSAEACGRRLIHMALNERECRHPRCWIFGGETTVNVRSSTSPQGGRNQHLALSALEEGMTASLESVLLLSIATDGEDGPTDAAGGFADQQASEQAKTQSLDITSALIKCQSFRALEQIGALVKIGPTGTNVMDLVIMLRQPNQAVP